MNAFDSGIVLWFNQFSQHSWFLDRSINFIAGDDLFKGGLFMAVIWWLWFAEDQEGARRRNREVLLVALGGVFVALALARTLAVILPFRLRPFAVSALAFKIPTGLNTSFIDWSSFPSDHAAMFAALATGMWFVSRRLGQLAMAYVVLVICLPRIYVGMHYPTDLLVGIFLGVTTVVVMNRSKLLNLAVQRTLDWSGTHRSLFYSIFFLVTFQMAVLFTSVIHVGSAIEHIMAGY
jgi:undecaprenyl-diphosphatase